MAKAGLLFVGTNDGIALYSDPGALGRWLRVGHELRGAAVRSVWVWADNPLYVLAATDTALYRSEDGGAIWAEVAGVAGGVLTGSRAAQASVVCVAQDGTLWRSADAGATWVAAGHTGIAGSATLAVSDDTTGVFVVASGRSVVSSADHGATWNILPELPAQAQQLALRPGDNTIYLIAQQQLYDYREGAWHLLRTTTTLPNAAVGGLAILGGREPTLLIAVPGGAIARSNDSGATWEHITSDVGWIDPPSVICAAPYHIDTAFAGGGSAIAISTDRGSTWRRLKGELAGVCTIAAARLV